MPANYWKSIDKLCKSVGFELERKTGDSRKYIRADDGGKTARLLFARSPSLEPNTVGILLKVWVSYKAVEETEARVFGTSYTSKVDCDTSIEIWRVDKNMRRAYGLIIGTENPESMPSWALLQASIQCALGELARAPGLSEILRHLTTDLKAIDDARSIWPWLPNPQRRVLYLLQTGRVDDARAWADDLYSALISKSPDSSAAYVREQEKVWATMLHEGKASL